LAEAEDYLSNPGLFVRDDKLDIPGDIRRQTMI
jgi:hypothetical protein